MTARAAASPFSVLAWDPGPEKSAWALVRWDGGPRAIFVDGAVLPFAVGRVRPEGTVEPSGEEAALALFGLVRAAHAAVEQPEGFAYALYRVPGLLGAADAAGALKAMARAAGLTPWAVPAPIWRGDLVRSKSPTDAQIAVAVRGLVDGLPKLPKTSGAHVYDACGLAIYVLRKLGARLVLNPEVEAELYRQTRTDKARSKAKSAKTRGRGLPVPGELFAWRRP